VVSSIEASEQTGQAATDLLFRKESLFKWVNTLSPKFEIIYPEPDNTILVTKDQLIEIKPQGWKPQDGFNIDFKVNEKGSKPFIIE
jgi:hypothetical protein